MPCPNFKMVYLICKNCKKLKQHRAKGMCKLCYDMLEKRQFRLDNKNKVNKQQSDSYFKNKIIICDKRKKERNLFKNKFRARDMIKNMIRKGIIIRPNNCERCDDVNPQAHHPDYSKPLEVKWLCKRCHMQLHHTTLQDLQYHIRRLTHSCVVRCLLGLCRCLSLNYQVY